MISAERSSALEKWGHIENGKQSTLGADGESTVETMKE